MTLAIATDRSQFSIVTIADVATTVPAWHERLRWPVVGDSHVALDMARAGRQRLWAAQIDDAILGADRQVLLIADGIGCLAASWWARLSPAHYVSRVGGALLLDPTQSPGRPDQFRSPPTALPFPTAVLTASDAHAPIGADLESLIASWGSRTIAGGRQRRVEGTAWRNAHRLIRRVTSAVVAHDIDRGLALRGDDI